MGVKQTALGVLHPGLTADRAKQGIVEFPRPVDVVASDHDMTEHFVVSSPNSREAGRFRDTNRTRFAGREKSRPSWWYPRVCPVVESRPGWGVWSERAPWDPGLGSECPPRAAGGAFKLRRYRDRAGSPPKPLAFRAAPHKHPTMHGLDSGFPARVKAVLGPTNTGKTHLAIERMLGHASGIIGFPLRLLARENYDRMVASKGVKNVALITGEEKIVPPDAKWFSCTVEAMPLDRHTEFLAIDEIQLCADPDRGHVFTDRLLHARGMVETMFLGAETIRPLLRWLVPEAVGETRPRLSPLTHAGPAKLVRLPPRPAVVAFSAAEVYAIAELIRRRKGGCAVVMGRLSPRTRNAQVQLYQEREVDFLVATDAIGMGLNMDVDHVAFAGLGKFDGHRPRRLTAAEIAQIAGRAGRGMRDGTFGTTTECPPLTDEVVAAVEAHNFDALEVLCWRNDELDFSGIDPLLDSLSAPPPRAGLIKGNDASDLETLVALSRDPDIRAMAQSRTT